MGAVSNFVRGNIELADVTQITEAELNILDGATVTTDELNLLDGVTASTTEINILDGLTATTDEINYLDGVTSNIQTQLIAKENTVTGAATTITQSDLTVSRALVSNASGKVVVSDVSATEISYLGGVTSSIQTQINNIVEFEPGNTGNANQILVRTASGYDWQDADNASFTLPAATSFSLGGVIVGAASDLNVDSSGNLTLGGLSANKITSGILGTARIPAIDNAKLTSLINGGANALNGYILTADGSGGTDWLAAGSGSGHTIQDDSGTDQTAREGLQFKSPLTVTDDSTNDTTVVDISLTSNDIPVLNTSKITTGVFNVGRLSSDTPTGGQVLSYNATSDSAEWVPNGSNDGGSLSSTDFGTGELQISDWAEGNDTELIPIAKIASGTPSGSSLVPVYDTSTQELVYSQVDYGDLANNPISGTYQEVTIPLTGNHANILSGATNEIMRIHLDSNFQSGYVGADIPMQIQIGSAIFSSGLNEGDVVDSVQMRSSSFSNIDSNITLTIPLANRFTVGSDVSYTTVAAGVFAALDGVSITGGGITFVFGYDSSTKTISVSGVTGGNLSSTPMYMVSGDTSVQVNTLQTFFTFIQAGKPNDPTTITLDPDTGDSVYSFQLTDFALGSEKTATQSLNEIADALIALDADFTKSSVQDGVLFGDSITYSVNDRDGVLTSSSYWDIRDTSDSSIGSTYSNGDALSTLNGKYLIFLNAITGYVTGESIKLEFHNGSSAVWTISSTGTTSGGNVYYQLGTASNISGTLPANGNNFNGNDLIVSIEIDSKFIDIDLDTTSTINHLMTLTAGGGSNTDFQLTDIDAITGEIAQTTVTVTDYSGTEITSFTASSDSMNADDLSSIAETIVSSINSNIETPIDFTAVWNSSDSNIVLTSTPGTINGTWSVTINNNGVLEPAAGNIAVGTISITEFDINDIETLQIRNDEDVSLDMYNDSTELANGDTIEEINFFGINSAGAKIKFGMIRIIADDVTAGSEDTSIELHKMVAGTLTKVSSFDT